METEDGAAAAVQCHNSVKPVMNLHHHYQHYRGANLQKFGYQHTNNSIPQVQKPWNQNDNGNIRRRRPQSSNSYDVPIIVVKQTESTTSCSSNSNNSDVSTRQQNLCKVKKMFGGGFLDSTSYDGSSSRLGDDDDKVHSNATSVLRRLRLADSDDNDKGSSTVTTRVSNFTNTFQTKMVPLSAKTAYFRPTDSLVPRKDKSGRSARMPRGTLSKQVSEPALPLSRSPTEKTGNLRSNYAAAKGPKKSLHQVPNICRSASESDDDDDHELKRMENMTLTFQRSTSVSELGDSSKTKSKKNLWENKFSPVTMSKIGVDVSPVRSSDSREERRRVHTPREAAYASCSISSFLGEILESVTPPKKEGCSSSLSPFDIVKNMLSPDRGKSTNAGKKGRAGSSRYNNEDGREDWSVDVDLQSEAVTEYTSYDDDDDRSESYVESRFSPSFINKNQSDDTGRSSDINYSHRKTPRGGDCETKRRETFQEKYDRNLTYRNYHRTDLSYYGTEVGGGTIYTNTKLLQYSHDDDDDDRSDTVSRVPEQESFHRRSGRVYRDSPFVARHGRAPVTRDRK